jgi:hypothetical protein
VKKTAFYSIGISFSLFIVAIVLVNYFDGQTREIGVYLLIGGIVVILGMLIPSDFVYGAFSRR